MSFIKRNSWYLCWIWEFRLIRLKTGENRSQNLVQKSIQTKTGLRMRLKPVLSVQTALIRPFPGFSPLDPLRRPHLKAARPCSPSTRETTSLVRLARGKNAAACAAIWLRQLPPGAKSGAQGIEPTIWRRCCPTVLVAPAACGGIMQYRFVPAERKFLKKQGVPAEASTTTNITITQPTCRRPTDGSGTGLTSKHVPVDG